MTEYPLTPLKDLSGQALGSVSRGFYDPATDSIYAGFRYPGVVAHVGALSLNDGSIDQFEDIKGPMLFRVTALAFDPDNRTLFYTTDNTAFRDLVAIDIETGESQMLLRDARIDYEWGGKIGIVVDRVPALGRIEGNVYYCQGYSGHGVNATHIMGEILADAIGGTLEKFDLWAQMKHVRIPGSQTFGNQMLALGMLYYRMKDLLP